MNLVVLDFSGYGNPFDPLSDALIVEACRRRGWAAEIRAAGCGKVAHGCRGRPSRPGRPATGAEPFPEPTGTISATPLCRHEGRRETPVSRIAKGPTGTRSEGLPRGHHGGRRETPVTRTVKGLSGRDGVSVWLRYDLRTPEDLAWVVQVARDLKQSGVRVFPRSEAIEGSEDKWLTARALAKAGIPIPPTALGTGVAAGSLAKRETEGPRRRPWQPGGLTDVGSVPFPLIVKPRVGWGARQTQVFRSAAEPGLAEAVTGEAVVQPFLPHDRTLIAAVAAGRPLACIEDIGGGLRAEGRVGTIAFPPGAADLAARALAAVGLVTGTVDLIETVDGLRVLEVNSAPRLTYPHLPEIDLAGPMVEAVLAWWGSEP
ncbi:MAG: ATP-grasp domain-containing protein [Candidatus Riflebacteria bacterium]|nr:ATP-grasp domain-containing protein [Candidatus Riflebacteria bacterium]